MPGMLTNPQAEIAEEDLGNHVRFDRNINSVDDFQPHCWVPLFIFDTPATRFVDLSADFIANLTTGQIFLAPSTETASGPSEIEWSDGSIDILPATASRQRDLFGVDDAIRSAIASLGTDVSPKLGARCPTDASWANFDRSTRCSTPDDVLTLLQSSERVMNATSPTRPAKLALRAWVDVDPRMEFRLFVKHATLIAVSHRAPHAAFEFSDSDADSVVEHLSRWFTDRIVSKFDIASDYVIDVCLPDRHRTFLIDFAPWRGPTDSLLFDWDELDHAAWMPTTNRAQFRAVGDVHIRPSLQLYHGLPVELRRTDVLSDLANIAQRLVREQPDNYAQSSSSEDDSSDDYNQNLDGDEG